MSYLTLSIDLDDVARELRDMPEKVAELINEIDEAARRRLDDRSLLELVDNLDKGGMSLLRQIVAELDAEAQP